MRPEDNGPWVKFDDDHVTTVPPKEALDANFGSDDVGPVGVYLCVMHNDICHFCMKMYANMHSHYIIYAHTCMYICIICI